MLRYVIDTYPRTNPLGARIGRFSGLQKGDFRSVASGVGHGSIMINAGHPDAALIDPRGLQYNRVRRINDAIADGATLSGFNELVVGGFFFDRGDYQALTVEEKRELVFGGAETLAYLQRAVMWSHTYNSPGGMDPFDGMWRLSAQGIWAGGNHLGAMLWRIVTEAQMFQSGAYTHRHGDGLYYTDTHSDDRVTNAIPAITITFDQFVDSNGNPWTKSAGDFTARVGESVFEVTRRLIELGLYVYLNPDTFELSAWESNVHRAMLDLTGGAWGAGVVRFQAPTGGDITTGNIKSDAIRGIEAAIQRSIVLAGGQGDAEDVYGIATAATDVPWEGFVDSEAGDAAALEDIAEVQVSAHTEATDSFRLKIRLGTNENVGEYAPFEDILNDALVTVNTGNDQWEYDELPFPVAGQSIELSDAKAGTWDAFAELGSVFTSLAQRAFQVQPPGAHSHKANPPLCPPTMLGQTPTIASAVDDFYNTLTNDFTITVTAGQSILVFSTGENVLSVQWHYDTHPNIPASPFDAFIKLDEVGADQTEVWYLADPTLGTAKTLRITVDDADKAIAAVFVVNAFGETPTIVTNSGTGTGVSTATGASSGDLIVDWLGWRETVGTPTASTPGGTQTPRTSETFDASPGISDLEGSSSSAVGAANMTWTTAISVTWTHLVAVFASTPGQNVLNGTFSCAARGNHQHHWHATTGPTLNDDITVGFRVGTRWAQLDDLDTPTEIIAVWIAVDVSDGAAIWIQESGHPQDHAVRHSNGETDELTVESLGTGETDTDLFLRPDGTGGLEFAGLPGGSGVLTVLAVIDGGGAEITTGVAGDLGPFDFDCEIEQVTILADQSGSIVIDLWKDTYANYPPTDADSITASAPPTISSTIKSQDGTLTGWTTTIATGDILRVNVDSVTDIERVTLALKVRRT